MQAIQRIALLTSGGDAPGMNAAIRAIVRSSSAQGITTVGVRKGFAGLSSGNFEELTDRQVGGILQHGGTMLGSMRHVAFRDEATQLQALHHLRQQDIDGLIVIGGNGSQQGSLALHRLGFPVVGIASTIDNDLAETETSIGVDTALNTAMAYIDRLKDTATSHHRAFIVELMGRDSGYLAVMTAIATGAESVVVPEFDTPPEEIIEDVIHAYERGKAYYIAIVAEGAKLKAPYLAQYLDTHPGSFEARLGVLGHVQRGGSPTVRDRVLASELGVAAVVQLTEGHTGVVIGWVNSQPTPIAFERAIAPCHKVTRELLQMVKLLSR